MRKLVTFVLNTYKIDEIIYADNKLNIVFNSLFDAINISTEIENNNIKHILKDKSLIFDKRTSITIKTNKVIITTEGIIK